MTGWHRIPDGRWRTPIGHALQLLEEPLRERLGHVRWVCGVDPAFAGLHRFDDDPRVKGGPYAYRVVPHCCYPYHLAERPAAERATTIVLPEPPSLSTVVHELGHALDWQLGLEHVAAPVTGYARTSRAEAFAEAFMGRYFWMKGEERVDDDARLGDRATVELFDRLAGVNLA